MALTLTLTLALTLTLTLTLSQSRVRPTLLEQTDIKSLRFDFGREGKPSPLALALALP